MRLIAWLAHWPSGPAGGPVFVCSDRPPIVLEMLHFNLVLAQWPSNWSCSGNAWIPSSAIMKTKGHRATRKRQLTGPLGHMGAKGAPMVYGRPRALIFRHF